MTQRSWLNLSAEARHIGGKNPSGEPTLRAVVGSLPNRGGIDHGETGAARFGERKFVVGMLVYEMPHRGSY